MPDRSKVDFETPKTACNANAPAADRSIGLLCPYITKPFSDCYCFQISSQKIPLALTFCGGNHQQCEIFQRHTVLDEEVTLTPWSAPTTHGNENERNQP